MTGCILTVPVQSSALTSLRASDTRPAGRPAALDQTGGEPGCHYPLRRQLHHVVHRVADGMGPAPQTRPLRALAFDFGTLKRS